MKISAIVKNRQHEHHIEVSSDGQSKAIGIPSKTTGYGSSVNGAELLLLSLATCYCNDIYGKPIKRGSTFPPSKWNAPVSLGPLVKRGLIFSTRHG